MTIANQIDLRPLMPPVYDQGQLGSCTGNAIAAAYEFDMIRQKEPSFIPSRLFIYFNERQAENTVATDSGAIIHDGIAVIEKYGVCPEELWPYDISKFSLKPSDEAYKAALRHTALKCTAVALNVTSIQQTLANGFPVVVGIQLFPAFDGAYAAKTGNISMPNPTENTIGGHAVVICGIDIINNHFIMRNSWGVDWGDNGYFFLSLEYILYFSDAWCIEVIV